MAVFGKEKLIGRTGKVVEIEMVTPHMKRVRLAGKELRHQNWGQGHHIRIFVDSLLKLHDSLRSYSVWHYDGEEGLVDLLMLVHGEGPGSKWVEKVKVGDSATFISVLGRFRIIPEASYYLLAAEETGAVALQALWKNFPAEKKVLGAFEADTPEDALPDLPGKTLPWVYRQGKPASPESGLFEKIELPPEPGVAYVAGETKTCLAIRSYLLEKGWPKQNLQVKPFWEAGRTGLD